MLTCMYSAPMFVLSFSLSWVIAPNFLRLLLCVFFLFFVHISVFVFWCPPCPCFYPCRLLLPLPPACSRFCLPLWCSCACLRPCSRRCIGHCRTANLNRCCRQGSTCSLSSTRRSCRACRYHIVQLGMHLQVCIILRCECHTFDVLLYRSRRDYVGLSSIITGVHSK